MQIKKLFHQKRWLLIFLLMIPLVLAGCGNSNPAEEATNKANHNAQNFQSSSQQTNGVAFYQGQPELIGHYISLPVVLENVGTNPLTLDTSNISLRITRTTTVKQKHLFKTTTSKINHYYYISSYSPALHPSTFNLPLKSNDQWQSFMLFKLNDAQYHQFTKNDIQSSRLIYTTPYGAKKTASMIPKNVGSNQLAPTYSVNQPVALADYYQNITDIQNNVLQEASVDNHQLKKMRQQASSSMISKSSSVKNSSKNSSVSSSSTSSVSSTSSAPPTLHDIDALTSSAYKDQYDDKNYGDLHFTVTKIDDYHVMLTFSNQTAEPLNLSLGNLQFEGQHDHQVMLATRFANYSLYIPSQKTTYAILPTANALGNENYNVRLKSDDNNSSKYISTTNLPNPIIYQKEGD